MNDFKFKVGDVVKSHSAYENCYSFYSALFCRAGLLTSYVQGARPDEDVDLEIVAALPHCSVLGKGSGQPIKLGRQMYICKDSKGGVFAFDGTSLELVKVAPTGVYSWADVVAAREQYEAAKANWLDTLTKYQVQERG